ncbi:MAG TPA: FAD-dependent oxidoreductase [Candidatus Dormibacteraeota bacterium]
MPEVIVIGAGPVGLATAMLLAKDGYRVTVLDKDPDGPPDEPWEAWERWERKGVAQFRQPHFMMPRFRHVLDSEFPEVRRRIEKIGGRRVNLTAILPHSLPDRSSRPGDERFETITARRPVLESAFAHAAERTPGVEIRRGVGAIEPIAGHEAPPGVPHVTGVITTKGDRLAADIVVDAMGRRSKLSEWVERLGGRAPAVEASDAGFAYYTRHFRSRDGQVPEVTGPFGVDMGTVRMLTLPGDNNAWTLAVVPMAGDTPFKALRHNDVWTRVVACVPHAAHWLDGEPITDVIAMAGVLDRLCRIVVDGRPVVTGLVPVGDAWACTNPTAGRGISLGLAHAVALRDTVREKAGDPVGLVARFDEVTEATLTPWFRDQYDRDRQRAADTQAVLDGRPMPPPDPAQAKQTALLAAVAADPEVARGWLDTLTCLALPAEVMQRAGMQERVAAFAGRTPDPMPGPTRPDLLAAVAGS